MNIPITPTYRDGSFPNTKKVGEKEGDKEKEIEKKKEQEKSVIRSASLILVINLDDTNPMDDHGSSQPRYSLALSVTKVDVFPVPSQNK